MKILDYDAKDVKKLNQIEDIQTAREFLEDGVSIIVRLRPRDFFRVEKVEDLNQAKRLKDMGVYEIFQLYIE